MSASEKETARGSTAPGIGMNDAAAFLRERYGGEAAPLTDLSGGAWSSAFAFSRDSADYVIRFSQHLEDFTRDRLARRWIAPALPIPIVTEIGEALGLHYAISERLYGDALDDLDGPGMQALLPSFFATLDALRRADLAGTSGYGGWDAGRAAPFASWAEMLLSVVEDPPEHRAAGWWRRLESSPMGRSAFDVGLARLQAAVGYAPTERYLVHSDLLNRNVLVANNEVTGVLDWGCSLYGDFLYDLAWFVFFAPWYPQWAGIDFLTEAKRHYREIGLEVPGFDPRMRLCLLHIGLNHIAYNAWLEDWPTAEHVAARMLSLTT